MEKTVTGIIVNNIGNPITNATLNFVRNEDNFQKQIKTDNNGKFLCSLPCSSDFSTFTVFFPLVNSGKASDDNYATFKLKGGDGDEPELLSNLIAQ